MTTEEAEALGPSPLWRLMRYARPYVRLFALSLCFTVGLSLTQYGKVYLLKPVIDSAVAPAIPEGADASSSWIPSLGGSLGAETESPANGSEANPEARTRTFQLAKQVLVLALALILLTPVFLFGQEYTVQYFLGRIDLDMKVDVCAKLLRLPMRFHQEQQRGDTLTRTMGDTSTAHQALGILFGDFLASAVMILVGAVVLCAINWRLALLIAAVGPIIGLVISGFGRRIRHSARRRQEQLADVNQRLLEILDGIKVIKAFRGESAEAEGFGNASLKLFRRVMKVVKNRVIARSLVDALNNGAAIGVIVLGAWLLSEGRWGLTPGDLAAFVGVTVTGYKPVRSVARGFVRMMDAQPSAQRFFDLLDKPVEIDDAEDAIPLERITRGIEVRDLGFSYGREPVLQHVSFGVRAGEVLAIVGRTGSGKTTLTDLLLRLYDPDEGSIEVDGMDLRKVKRETLLDQVAVVTQEPFLFDGTIRQNIRYGRADASDDEILAAARAAHVDEFVGELPDGYDTEVGAAGTRLSGGQRQRVTIARAILRDPALLILDEATSSLDSKAERSVQDALEALLPGRTVIVIAHRLSTVRKADQIVVLEGGRISQSGTHDELMGEGGLYQELVELQGSGDTPLRL
jgi:subfamily B ATP-binding cassette protein MsbA